MKLKGCKCCGIVMTLKRRGGRRWESPAEYGVRVYCSKECTNADRKGAEDARQGYVALQDSRGLMDSYDNQVRLSSVIGRKWHWGPA